MFLACQARTLESCRLSSLSHAVSKNLAWRFQPPSSVMRASGEFCEGAMPARMRAASFGVLSAVEARIGGGDECE